MDHELYEWGRHTLRKIDELGRDVLKIDTEKKPPIPESNEARTGVVKKFKDKMDEQAKRKREIFKRMGKNV